MTNQIQMFKCPKRSVLNKTFERESFGHLNIQTFEFDSSFVIRHSNFVIKI